jgi:predicted Fe-S protein YdhL (DUF1289 family)
VKPCPRETQERPNWVIVAVDSRQHSAIFMQFHKIQEENYQKSHGQAKLRPSKDSWSTNALLL